jgi:hypothetical protein
VVRTEVRISQELNQRMEGGSRRRVSGAIGAQQDRHSGQDENHTKKPTTLHTFCRPRDQGLYPDEAGLVACAMRRSLDVGVFDAELKRRRG